LVFNEFSLSAILFIISVYSQGCHSTTYFQSFSTICAHTHFLVNELFIGEIKSSSSFKSAHHKFFLKFHKSFHTDLILDNTFHSASFTAISVVFCKADGKVPSLDDASAQSNICDVSFHHNLCRDV
jgi:hypothetical protein